jgi:hypothetical protein
MTKYQVIIGRFEHINISGLFEDVPAKIDTGAYRSSIHAYDIEEFKLKSGSPRLRFRLLGHGSSTKSKLVKVKTFTKRKVTSSSGHQQTRYEVKLRISIAGKTFSTPFTLTNRSQTVFPILIGRKALNSRFLVDVSKTAVNRAELRFKLAGVTYDEEDLEGVTV